MRALCLCTVYRSVRDMSQSELRDNQAKVLLLDDWVVTGGSERLRGVKDCWSCGAACGAAELPDTRSFFSSAAECLCACRVCIFAVIMGKYES